MISVVSKETMQALDRHMIENMKIISLLLMENAAFGITTAVSDKFDTDTQVVVICGGGNNGGDGFATARQLMAKGYTVDIYLLSSAANLKGDAKTNVDFFGNDIKEVTDAKQICIPNGGVIIDAIFGIGLSREVTGLYADVIGVINSSKAYTIACDIASGIDSNAGQVLGTAVKADETITFACAKQGHMLFPGREYTGKLTVKEIGVFGDFDIGSMSAYRDGLELKKRTPNSHKGVYGKLACVVGSRGMSGAGIMCVGGALRAGAGLTTIGIPRNLQDICSSAVPECMTFALDDEQGALSFKCVPGIDELIKGKTALAAGCGLSVCSGTIKAVEHMVRNYDISKVFDADAINVISQNPSVLDQKAGNIVLTPHIGEFARLCKTEITNPLEQAKDFAEKHGVILLLKGATTIVTDGNRTAFVLTGTPGMAKGGSGDVLTGVIGGLLASGFSCFDAALYGAYICGKAGESAAKLYGEHSMTAMDTLSQIGSVMMSMTK